MHHKTRRIITISTLLLSGGLAAPLQAQGFGQACEQAVAKLCRPGEIGACFEDEAKWTLLPEGCTGDVQTMIEMEREAKAEQEATPLDQLTAFSYGGILRQGPSMDSPKKASLRPGQPIRILEDPDIWFDQYKWYKVQTKSGTGYHWGGIFCTQGGTKPDGVLYDCGEYPPGSF